MNQYGVDLDVDKPIFEYEELGRLLNRFHRDSGNMQRLLDFINKYILKGSKLIPSHNPVENVNIITTIPTITLIIIFFIRVSPYLPTKI